MWFHYSCIGLNNKDVAKIPKRSPFICNGYNDNELYIDVREKDNDLSEMDSQIEMDIQDVTTEASLNMNSEEGLRKLDIPLDTYNSSVNDSNRMEESGINDILNSEENNCKNNTIAFKLSDNVQISLHNNDLISDQVLTKANNPK